MTNTSREAGSEGDEDDGEEGDDDSEGGDGDGDGDAGFVAPCLGFETLR